jgi:hypothetical protein
MIDIRALPIYLDGSDGSLWASRDAWEDILCHPEVAQRRFIRASDLIQWLETNNYPMMDLSELIKLSIQKETCQRNENPPEATAV